jgi:hypothetical protein
MARPIVGLVPVALAAASIVAAQPAPSELSVRAAKARLDRPVAAWCRGEFRSGRPGAFAVAVASPADAGRYLVLETDATVVELGSFTRGADLSCYSPAEAEKLNVTIGRSDTIHGQIAPRWRTTVVCGFVDATKAVCWQCSPVESAYIEVGHWVT